ncbi:DUF2513 domain-containing protein (plasmid) [Pseudomonas fragi]|uniref:DUF2513 domain-containing protein n=1 Tax=Pseudomonas fragi TaxID=296 RepID=UPI0021C122AE|nr:DUF2513 domain-containing protein [Pseudomonas fragi]UXL41077.1 DUF2513 domain-containing protein [Pseudomonas fragi]
MKLDKDLVREILLAVEASKNDPKEGIDLVLKDRSPREISYHVLLLTEAGFVLSRDAAYLADAVSIWQPTRLTYKGHEFLDTVRNGEVWRRTKAGAEKAGVAGLGVLLELGKAYGKEVLKERLGIELS